MAKVSAIAMENDQYFSSRLPNPKTQTSNRSAVMTDLSHQVDVRWRSAVRSTAISVHEMAELEELREAVPGTKSETRIPSVAVSGRLSR